MYHSVSHSSNVCQWLVTKIQKCKQQLSIIYLFTLVRDFPFFVALPFILCLVRSHLLIPLRMAHNDIAMHAAAKSKRTLFYRFYFILFFHFFGQFEFEVEIVNTGRANSSLSVLVFVCVPWRAVWSLQLQTYQWCVCMSRVLKAHRQNSPASMVTTTSSNWTLSIFFSVKYPRKW